MGTGRLLSRIDEWEIFGQILQKTEMIRV